MIPLSFAKPLTRFARGTSGLLVAVSILVADSAFSAEQVNATTGNSNSPAFTSSDPTELFAIESWTTEHGLPQTSVTSVLQTRAGYLWAATYDGIAQFDGVRFIVFDSGNTEGLANSRVTALFEDSRGEIWIGHDKGGLTRYHNGHFDPHPIHRAWNNSPVQVLHEDAKGDVWAINVRGQALRLRDEVLIEPPAPMAEQPWVWPEIARGNSGKLLLVRNGGVAEFDSGGSRQITIGTSTNPTPYYNRIASARAGGLWVIGEGRLRRWDGTLWAADFGPVPWGNVFVTKIVETSTGYLLVGTLENGLYVYAAGSGWMHLDRQNGLLQDWVRCLAEDKQQNVWVGTSGGLTVLRPRKVVTKTPPDAWQGRPVLAITQTSEGSIWAATEGAGVYRLHDNQWTHFDATSGLENVFVWAIAEDAEHGIWAGTWGGGIFHFENGRFSRPAGFGSGGDAVTAIKADRDGVLWVGTSAGLFRGVSNRFDSLAALGGAAAGDVRALECAEDGSLWIGTQGHGLGRLKGGTLHSFDASQGLPRDYILCLYAEDPETLWIGTLDRGICRYRGGRFVSISTGQGLPNNTVCHIEDDKLGNLWLNSQRGLLRLSKRELNDCADGKLSSVRAVAFGKAEGMPTLAATGGFTPSGFRASDGKLWFPTARGVVVVNPNDVKRNSVPPEVWIEEVSVDAKRIDLARAEQTPRMDEMSGTLRRIKLQPGRRDLDIVFTGVTFTGSSEVRFRYRLEGLDRDWTDGGTRRRVTYSYLPPGNYRFRVIAANGDDVWNQEGDALDVIVLPHVWQTWWFRALAGIAILTALGGTIYWESRRRNRRKLERVTRERELERERARIAQDIHDDLGASLTRIGMLSQSAAGELNDPSRAAADLGQIYSTARELTRAMDEIVWAVNPRHDTLDSLTNYISRFAYDYLSAANIRCRLDTPIRVPDLTVRSEVRHNLLLALKETLNNVVKHSRATEVRITLQLLEGGLQLEIADNGCGFNAHLPNEPESADRVSSGNGIPGIRNRMAQIGGQLAIETAPAEGTHVRLFVALATISQPGQGI